MAKILALVLLFALSPALAEESCEVAGNCAEALDFDDVGLLQVKAEDRSGSIREQAVCKDDNVDCGKYADGGLGCDPNIAWAAWMTENCKKSCGHCQASVCAQGGSETWHAHAMALARTGAQGVCACTGTVWYGKKFVHGSNTGEHGNQVGATTSLNQLVLAVNPKMKSGYRTRSVVGSVSCSAEAMGGDPFPGYYKWCLCAQADGISGECPGGWKQGDGIGTETHVGRASSQADCIKLVKIDCPACNGATLAKGSGKRDCYSEMDMTGVSQSSWYQTCRFVPEGF